MPGDIKYSTNWFIQLCESNSIDGYNLMKDLDTIVAHKTDVDHLPDRQMDQA